MHTGLRLDAHWQMVMNIRVRYDRRAALRPSAPRPAIDDTVRHARDGVRPCLWISPPRSRRCMLTDVDFCRVATPTRSDGCSAAVHVGICLQCRARRSPLTLVCCIARLAPCRQRTMPSPCAGYCNSPGEDEHGWGAHPAGTEPFRGHPRLRASWRRLRQPSLVEKNRSRLMSRLIEGDLRDAG